MINRMKQWTVLKVYFLIYLASCIIYTIAKWNILSEGEGWGVVYMFMLITIGLVGFVADILLAWLIKDRRLLNGLEIIIAIFFSMRLWIELN